jgi:hypothetical protein
VDCGSRRDVEQLLFQVSVTAISLEILIARRVPLVSSFSSVGARSLGNQAGKALLHSPVLKRNIWWLQTGLSGALVEKSVGRIGGD